MGGGTPAGAGGRSKGKGSGGPVGPPPASLLVLPRTLLLPASAARPLECSAPTAPNEGERGENEDGSKGSRSGAGSEHRCVQGRDREGPEWWRR